MLMPPEPPRLPATRAEIAALIPHQGAMCLLDCVKEWSEDAIVCGTRTHAMADNPLLRNGLLSAVHLCEYGAQAAAVHGGLSTRNRDAPVRTGVLVALRDVVLTVATVDQQGSLEVRARRVYGGAAGWQYEFSVSRDNQLLATGRATIMLTSSA